MPPHIYSVRLVGPVSVPAGGTNLLATVPSGKVWILKQLIVYNSIAGGDLSFTFFVRPAGSALGASQSATITGGKTIYQDLFLPMTADETISGKVPGATGSMYVTIGGYELDAE